jgi:hypothetical protein
VTVQFPGKIATVVRVSLAPPCVVMEEVPEKEIAHLTWPDFPEAQKMWGLGLTTKGGNTKQDDTRPASEVAALLGEHLSGGYLTVIGGHFAMFSVMTSEYVQLCGSTRKELGRILFRHGRVVHEKVRPSYFVTGEDEPVKTRPLPRPYGCETCWVGKDGSALLDIREFCRFMERHAGIIGDPYAWTSVKRPVQGPFRLMLNDNQETVRMITLGEDA